MTQLDFTTREGRRAQGVLIQQAADAAGLSLETLAREVGCSRALIYQYVSGATLAQADRVQAIAARTGKPLPYFYGVTTAPGELLERLSALQALLQAQLGPQDLAGALSTCEQLMALAHQAGEVRIEATARLKLAGGLLQAGDPGRALRILEETIPFLQAHNLATHLRAAEQSRGHALLALGRVEEAETAFTRVAASGEWAGRWQGAVSLAAVAEQRGHFAQAIELLDNALLLEDAAPNPAAARALRLYVLGNLANIHLACADITAAARAAEEARELALQAADQSQYLEALLTLGVCQRIAGKLPESRNLLTSAARWARLAGDSTREALGNAELAHTLVEIGCLDEARATGKDALQQAIAGSVRRAEFTAHLALARAYQHARIPQEARYHAAQAWEISVHLGHPAAQATALGTLGAVQLAQGNLEEARQALLPAFDLADTIGARLPALEAAIGVLQLGGGDPQAVLARADEINSPLLRWPALLAAAKAYEATGELTTAEGCCREAIAVIAALREPLLDEPDGDTYLEYQLAWEPYLRLAHLLRLRGLVREADAVLATAAWPPLDALQAEEV